MVGLLTSEEQIASGGVTKVERAKHRLAELAERQPGILQDQAITQIAGELDTSERTVKDGLKAAKADRWIAQRKAETDKRGQRPLVLYTGEGWER